MLTGKLIVAFGVLALSGWAQTSAGVAGPVTGFIFDAPSGAIRAMLGIPGAAYLGNIVGTGLEIVAVAPDGSAALGVQRTGRLVLYTGLRSSAAQMSKMAGAIQGADLIAWNADASAAVVYAVGSRQAQIVTGLPNAPAAGPPIDLSNVPGRVTALVFDGQHILAGVPGDAGGIFLASASSPAQRIASSPSPSAIALAGGSLYFADNQSQQIWQIGSYATAPAAVLFANDSGVSGPDGLQVSADGQRLLVANAGNQTLTVYDLTARSVVQSLDLAFTPTRLDRFGDASVFLMNGAGHGPLYVVRDGGAGKAAVFFVPAPAGQRPHVPVRPL
jgi:hypothetical protein